jgi:integrase
MPRGPQPRYVRDDAGREIHGLCQEKFTRNGVTVHRYYSWYDDQGKRRKKYHGTSRELVAAVFAFRQWEASRSKETIRFGDPTRVSFDGQVITDIAKLQEMLEGDETLTMHEGNEIRIPADMAWKKIGQLIMNDPQLASQKTGIKELARLHTLPMRTAPLRLTEIRDAFLTDKSFKYSRQAYDAHTAWDQFAEAVGRSTIEEITTTDIARYYGLISKKRYAPRTVKNLIRTIQAFLNYAVAIRKAHRPELQELKQDIRNICKIPTQKEPSPQPIDKDDFLALVAAVEQDAKWYAILLTALNLALHGNELAEVEIAEVNLKRGEFGTRRTKTGVARVAKLMDRTVAAIRRYQQTDHFKKNPTKYLFTNKHQQPFNIRSINAKMRVLRKQTELPQSVVFDGIRDLFRRAAGAKNFVATKWVMGHSLAIDDVYAFRDVEETVETMQKVEAYVFGKAARAAQKTRKKSQSKRR